MTLHKLTVEKLLDPNKEHMVIYWVNTEKMMCDRVARFERLKYVAEHDILSG